MTEEELEILEKELYENKKVICVITKENKILYKLACRDDFVGSNRRELCIMIPRECNQGKITAVTEVVPKRSFRFQKVLEQFEEAVASPDNKIETREAKK